MILDSQAIREQGGEAATGKCSETCQKYLSTTVDSSSGLPYHTAQLTAGETAACADCHSNFQALGFQKRPWVYIGNIIC